MEKTRSLNGYIVVHRPDHPRSMNNRVWKGWIYEHIVVAEEILDRPLRKEEVVHHLNGNREDNSPENLLVLESSQHTKLHRWIDNGALYSKEYSENRVNSGKSKATTRCKRCNKAISRNRQFCSNECRIISRRKVVRPAKSVLQKEIADCSWTSLGKKYGVSGNSVRKWAKSYGLL